MQPWVTTRDPDHPVWKSEAPETARGQCGGAQGVPSAWWQWQWEVKGRVECCGCVCVGGQLVLAAGSERG